MADTNEPTDYALQDENGEGTEVKRIVPTISERRREEVREYVKKMRPMPVRDKGALRHPSDFNAAELEVISDSLRNMVPIHVIANHLHCSRKFLGEYINKHEELRELKMEQKENLYETAVFQADKLAKQGNASIIMFILERLGKDKGWSQNESSEGGGGDEGKIIMGVIPDDVVSEADAFVANITGKEQNKVFESDPMKAEMKAQLAQDEEKAAKGMRIDAESYIPKQVQNVKTSPAPYESQPAPKQQQSLTEQIEVEAIDDYGTIPGAGAYSGNDYDPYASGGDSMFFQ